MQFVYNLLNLPSVATDASGQTVVEESDENRLYYIDSEGNRSDNYITVNNRKILDAFTGKDGIASYTDDSNIDDFFKVFLFAADNSNVEWALHGGRDNRYTLGAKHDQIFAGIGKIMA